MKNLYYLILSVFICNNISAQIFSKITEGEIVNTPSDSRSANWIDFNNDTWLDVQITNGNEAGDNNMLFANNGDGTFTQIIDQPIVLDNAPSDGATWGDYDNDGDADCFVVNWYGLDNLFYENNGDGSFTQITEGDFVNDGGHSETAAWGDYDNDGYLDLYVTNSAGTKRNFLYKNNGDKTFTKIIPGVQSTDGFASRSCNWIDFNNDNLLDLFVTNEADVNENLYQNNGDGTFTKITDSDLVMDLGKTMSSSWGDIDNDGDLDVVLANDLGDESLFRNDGDGVFTKLPDDITCNNGGNSFGSNFADIDNDGDLDLYISNAFWGSPWHNYLYLNNGEGTFTENTTDASVTDVGWSYGNAFGDYDKDGDMDLIVANCYSEGQETSLFKNETTGNNWIVIECEGVISNRSAIGAKVKVKSIIDGSAVWQLREISAQSGYCGQNMLPAHFGLSNADLVDSIIIQWPSGIIDSFSDLYTKQYLHVLEGESATAINTLQQNAIVLFPNPASNYVEINLPVNAIISFYDSIGRKVFTTSDSGILNLEEWTSGVYLFFVSNAGKIIGNGKLVVK